MNDALAIAIIGVGIYFTTRRVIIALPREAPLPQQEISDGALAAAYHRPRYDFVL